MKRVLWAVSEWLDSPRVSAWVISGGKAVLLFCAPLLAFAVVADAQRWWQLTLAWPIAASAAVAAVWVAGAQPAAGRKLRALEARVVQLRQPARRRARPDEGAV